MSPPDVGALEEEAVLRAVRSGWVAPTGPEVTAFEQEIASGWASGTRSRCARARLPCIWPCWASVSEPGDVVMVATMTFVASANAVTYLGATPYFVDVV